MSDEEKVLLVIFFRTASGRDVVREWLKSLPIESRKAIGSSVKVVQYRWPLGMPRVRKIERDLWEVRTSLSNKQIARTFFTIHENEMILLHGFIKKSQKTPANDLELARARRDLWLKWLKENDDEEKST